MRFLKANALYLAIALALFAIFATQNRYYRPAVLAIEGKYSSPVSVTVSWRTGERGLESEKISCRLGGGCDKDRIALPQLKIRDLTVEAAGESADYKIERVRLLAPEGDVLMEAVHDGKLPVNIAKPYRATRSFHSVLAAVQAAVSAAAGYLVYCLAGSLKRRGPIGKAIRESGFHVFIILFFFFAASFSFWLLGQWPGASNMDTFDVLTQVRTLDFHRWHTLVYPLYVLALSQFSYSPASVSAFQILACSLIGASIFYMCFRGGVRLLYLLPFIILFAFSVPIGLYNIYMMKDVPFAFLSALLAAGTFFLLYGKMYLGMAPEWTWKKLLFSASLLAALASIRHNGVIYIAIVPIVFYIGRIMQRRHILAFGALTIAVYAFVQLAAPKLMIKKEVRFPRIEAVGMTLQINPLVNLMRSPWYYTDDPEGDRKTLGKLMDVDRMKGAYVPYSADFILFHPEFKGWNLPESDYAEVQGMYFRRIPPNAAIFAAERVYVFMGALGFPVSAWTESLYHNAWLDVDYRAFPSLSDISFAPVSKALYNVHVRILKATGVMYRAGGKEFKLGLRLLVWNALIPLSLLVFAAAAYKYFPCSAAASLIILSQVPLLFILIAGSPFRFIYFIYYFGHFIIPLLLLERTGRRRLKPSSQEV